MKKRGRRKRLKMRSSLFGALFETMKEAHDARHIATKHERNIIFLPVEEVLSTEFAMSAEKKLGSNRV